MVWRRKLSPWTRDVVRDHPSAEHVLRPHGLAAVPLQHHERSAHLLAGAQGEVRQLLPGADADAGALIARGGSH